MIDGCGLQARTNSCLAWRKPARYGTREHLNLRIVTKKVLSNIHTQEITSMTSSNLMLKSWLLLSCLISLTKIVLKRLMIYLIALLNCKIR